ncbi:EEF1A lysine methyltransferase 1 isoform X1 [Diorhabda sublineata]|uniref:EEF1A lysine methyltransferase 1 isoform X1 n=1 Tax=Diorhabda sublineata TaxID=1163346 RepID=UPI0024E185C7|nr:EEF1A lysine methyltransferase 1 isoform X1 [Diorhabda sublineata]
MSESESNDDDVPQLSAETFAALQEFYKEQEERENTSNITDIEIVSFQEDWQLSQFWYDDNTIDILVKIALNAVHHSGKIALVSCPSLYKKMKQVAEKDCEITLFEYDRRFSAYGNDYIFYDYKSPLSIPREKSNYYDLVLADPPFLSDECLTKTAVTIKFLTKNKIVLCTGSIMEDMTKRLLNLKKNKFEPKHKNNLANEFSCYSNFDIEPFL